MNFNVPTYTYCRFVDTLQVLWVLSNVSALIEMNKMIIIENGLCGLFDMNITQLNR